MPYVLGVGAANVDLHGQSRSAIVMHDSNPGHLYTSAGGVTRNVCENLARLGADVRLLSTVGDDVYGELIRKSCREAGIDCSQLYVAQGRSSSTYISLLDEKGDMLVAMSDMTILKELPLSYLESKQDLLRGAAVVSCDGGLSPDAIERLLELCEGYAPVYVDPVSTAYARVVAPYIGRFHTAKPNVMELEILSDMSISDEESLLAAGRRVLDKGLRRLIVSLGADGCLYMDREGTILKRKLRPVGRMVNATGAGDSFMAGVIFGTLQGFPLEKTLDYALAAGIAAITHEKTINPHISETLIQSIIKEYAI